MYEGPIYGYGVTAGPLTEEGKQAALDAVAKGACPKCGQTLNDLRGVTFNAGTEEKAGQCFIWAEDAYTCVTPRAAR